MPAAMTTQTRRRKVNPARCECSAAGRLVYPCELIPAGIPVRVAINGTDYLLSAHGGQPEDGYRMSKLGGDRAVYDLDTSSGRPVCDCMDALVNDHRPCKHVLCLDQLHQRNVL